MKDRLGSSRWWNAPVKNPTQNRYVRFQKGPGGDLTSLFTKSQEAFRQTQEGWLKTMYSEYLDGGTK